MCFAAEEKVKDAQGHHMYNIVIALAAEHIGP